MADVGAALSAECAGMEKKEEEKEEVSPKQATKTSPSSKSHLS